MLSPHSRPAFLSLLATAALGFSSHLFAAAAAAPEPVIDEAAVEKTRALVDGKDARVQAALDALLADAKSAMKTKPVSVMEKDIVGASGDKHDYLSMARYWWPDPSKPGGLPYIRRDGEANREAIAKGDTLRLDRVIEDSNTLALAFALTGDNACAEHAAKLLRVFFLDPETKMNPNFNGAQAVLGKNQGRGTGLIEFRDLYALTDALRMLKASPAWTEDDQKGMREWMEKYAEWLATNDEAQKERAAANNHGTWFDVQEMAVLLYLGRDEDARKLAEEFKTKRIAPQIEPDGKQPDELKRTTALHYTLFNLEGMSVMAQLARRVGVDLWSFQTEDGRGMKPALDFALPYAIGGEKWPYQQINDVEPDRIQKLVFEAKQAVGGDTYDAWLEKTSAESLKRSREWLLGSKAEEISPQ